MFLVSDLGCCCEGEICGEVGEEFVVFFEEGVCVCYYFVVYEYIVLFFCFGVLFVGLVKIGVVNCVVEVRCFFGFWLGCFMGYDVFWDVVVVCCWVWGVLVGVYFWFF